MNGHRLSNPHKHPIMEYHRAIEAQGAVASSGEMRGKQSDRAREGTALRDREGTSLRGSGGTSVKESARDGNVEETSGAQRSTKRRELSGHVVCPRKLFDLMEQCFAKRADCRPTFDFLFTTLDQFDKLEPSFYAQSTQRA